MDRCLCARSSFVRATGENGAQAKPLHIFWQHRCYAISRFPCSREIDLSKSVLMLLTGREPFFSLAFSSSVNRVQKKGNHAQNKPVLKYNIDNASRQNWGSHEPNLSLYKIKKISYQKFQKAERIFFLKKNQKSCYSIPLG